MPRCEECFRSERTCRRCHSVTYCSDEHEMEDRPKHKALCRRLVEGASEVKRRVEDTGPALGGDAERDEDDVDELADALSELRVKRERNEESTGEAIVWDEDYEETEAFLKKIREVDEEVDYTDDPDQCPLYQTPCYLEQLPQVRYEPGTKRYSIGGNDTDATTLMSLVRKYMPKKGKDSAPVKNTVYGAVKKRLRDVIHHHLGTGGRPVRGSDMIKQTVAWMQFQWFYEQHVRTDEISVCRAGIMLSYRNDEGAVVVAKADALYRREGWGEEDLGILILALANRRMPDKETSRTPQSLAPIDSIKDTQRRGYQIQVAAQAVMLEQAGYRVREVIILDLVLFSATYRYEMHVVKDYEEHDAAKALLESAQASADDMEDDV